MEKFLVLACIFILMVSVSLNFILIFSTIPFKNRAIGFLRGKISDAYDQGHMDGWSHHKRCGDMWVGENVPPASDAGDTPE